MLEYFVTCFLAVNDSLGICVLKGFCFISQKFFTFCLGLIYTNHLRVTFKVNFKMKI